MSTLPCEDYSQFKQALIKLRKLDDLIVNRLNTTIPTDTVCSPSRPSSCVYLSSWLIRASSHAISRCGRGGVLTDDFAHQGNHEWRNDLLCAGTFVLLLAITRGRAECPACGPSRDWELFLFRVPQRPPITGLAGLCGSICSPMGMERPWPLRYLGLTLYAPTPPSNAVQERSVSGEEERAVRYFLQAGMLCVPLCVRVWASPCRRCS